MANTLHSTLTGSDLHECKGAASATLGTVMMSNGDGTGTFQSLPYTYITSTPVIPTVSYNGTVLTETPLVKHYQFNAVAGAFTQALSGFTTIHSIQAKCVSPVAGSSPVDVIITAQSTSSITGQIVDFAGALAASSTALVFLTVHGV